jgi:hypothetical protein
MYTLFIQIAKYWKSFILQIKVNFSVGTEICVIRYSFLLHITDEAVDWWIEMKKNLSCENLVTVCIIEIPLGVDSSMAPFALN